jgi:putative DNA primase/helicase
MTKPQGMLRSLKWDEIIEHLKSNVRAFSKKSELMQFVFGEFSNNYRSKDALISISALVIDVDNELKIREVVDGADETRPVKADPYLSMDDAVACIDMCGLSSIVYQTASYTDEWNKFRIVIPFSRPVVKSEYVECAEMILDATGLGVFSDAIDRCYSNPAQPYFYPSRRIGDKAGPKIIVTKGKPFSIPDITESQEVTKAIVRANNDIVSSDDWWKEYDGDLSTLDVMRLLDLRGLKYGNQQPSGAFQIDCPWVERHKMKAYFIPPTKGRGGAKWPIIKCSTDKCCNHSLQDFLALYGKKTVDDHCARPWSFDKGTVKNVTDIVELRNPKNVSEEKGPQKMHTADIATTITRRHTIIRTNDNNIFEYSEPTWKRITVETIRKYAQDYDSYYYSTKGRRAEAADFALNTVHSLDKVNWNSIKTTEIAFMDGVYDIETKELRPHRANDFIDNVLPHNAPQIESHSKIWEKCLNQWMDGEYLEEKKASLQEFFGYILMSEARFKKSLIMYGPTDSGKSLILQMMIFMVGAHNTCTLDINQMDNPRDLTAIYGKKLNAVSEIGANTKISDSGFKRLVSCEDSVQIRFNYHDPMMYKPTCKHVLCGNVLPIVEDYSGATMNRMLIISLPNRIAKQKQDPYIYTKLTAEIDGIIAWAVDGARRLIKNKGVFTECYESEAIVQTYAESQNVAFDFIDDCYDVTKNPVDMVPFEDMFGRYVRYMRKPMERASLVRCLFEMGIKSTRKMINGSRSRWVVGVRPTKRKDNDVDEKISFSSSNAFAEI